MEKVKFNLTEEAKVANSGGLALQNCEGKLTQIELQSQWEKEGSKRTKNGALGVNTTLGWLNASALIVFLMALNDKDPVRLLLIPTGDELIIDPSKSFFIQSDGKKITGVSMGTEVKLETPEEKTAREFAEFKAAQEGK